MIAATRTSMREARTIAALGSEHSPSAPVVLALARFEAKAIVVHPWFLGSIGICALLGVRSREIGDGVMFLIFGLAIGIGIGTFLSANQATRRARRPRMGELFASMPSPPEARTASLLLGTLAGPMALASAVAEIGLLYAATRFPGDPNVGLPLAVQIPLAFAAFGTLSIALGRWIPSPLAAPVALVGQVATGLGVWALPWIVGADARIRLGWHIVYVAAFAVFAAAAALLRDRRTVIRGTITAGAFATLVAGAVLQAA
jgi:hypothetical protein